MKRLITLGLVMLAGAVAVQFAPHAGTARAATTNVTVNSDFFAPTTVTVTVGDTVHWNWAGSDHSVTADDASFDSGVQNVGATFDMTFSTPGTFRYYCKIHGNVGGVGMSGVVIVQAAAAAPTSAAQVTSTNTALPTATGRATGTATNAPGNTTTPLASSTPLPTVSAAPTTPAPAVTTAAGSASPGGGVAGVGAALPSTGDGGSSGINPLRPLGVLLAVCGVAAIGAGVVLKRRHI